jgi:hypothetical protein
MPLKKYRTVIHRNSFGHKQEQCVSSRVGAVFQSSEKVLTVVLKFLNDSRMKVYLTGILFPLQNIHIVNTKSHTHTGLEGLEVT